MSATLRDLVGTCAPQMPSAQVAACVQLAGAAGTLSGLVSLVALHGLTARVVYFPQVTGKTGPNIDIPPDPGV